MQRRPFRIERLDGLTYRTETEANTAALEAAKYYIDHGIPPEGWRVVEEPES